MILLDSAYAPPSVYDALAVRNELLQLHDTNAEWNPTGWWGYLESPTASHAWSMSDFDTVIAANYGFGFVWVGPINFGWQFNAASHLPFTAANPVRNARIAVTRAQRMLRDLRVNNPARIVPLAPIALDIEAGAFASNPGACAQWARRWTAEVRRLGWTTVWYGNVGLFQRGVPGDERCGGEGCGGEVPNACWVAAWSASGASDKVPDVNAINGMPADWFTHHQRAVQFAGNAVIAGMGVDISVSDYGLAVCRAR